MASVIMKNKSWLIANQPGLKIKAGIIAAVQISTFALKKEELKKK